VSTPGFIRDDYWRVLFSLPIVLAAVQSALLLTVFNYETPKFLKQNKRVSELQSIMSKIYTSDKVAERIESIVISEGGDTPSY